MIEKPNGSKYAQVPAWAAIAITVLGIAASGWAKAGALEQRLITAESRLTELERVQMSAREQEDARVSQVTVDVSYIRGRVDYLSAAVQEIRQRQK